LKQGKYYQIESAIIDALESGPKRTAEISSIVHDRLPAGILSPDTKKEASNRITWKHEVRAALEGLHLRRKLVSLDPQSSLYSLRVGKEEAHLQIVEDEASVAASGQGYLQDSKKKKLIEEHAIKAAEAYLTEELHYKVDRHAGGQKYDLTCSRDEETIFVEVKGTVSDGSSVLLTAGEVTYARNHVGQMGLFVLHSVEINGDVVFGGKAMIRLPWKIDDDRLSPTHYLLTLE
jgi:hypothetical protein